MNHLIAISRMALFAACLIAWAAPAGAQPMGKLPSSNDLTAEASSVSTGEETAPSGEMPLRPRPAGAPGTRGPSAMQSGGGYPNMPGTPPSPGQPRADTPPRQYPGGPENYPPLPNPSTMSAESPLPLEGTGQATERGGVSPGAAPQSLNGAPTGTILPPLGGAAEANEPAANNADRPAESALTSADPDNSQEPAVRLQWVGPSVAKINQPNSYSLVVRNICTTPVQQVLVRVRVPAGLSCGDTEPKAVAEGNVLVWELGALQPKEEKVLHLKLAAEQKGDVAPQAWVTFTGSSILHIKVREPKLAIQVQGPEKLLLGETAAFQVAVANVGDGSADQVKVHVNLSKGLECPRGSSIDFDIGALGAGEARNVTVMCLTKKGGTQKCEVTAEAGGGLHAKETAQVNVTMPRLELQLVGPALRYLGRKALYTLKVANPGNAAATNITLSDVVPEGFKVLAASDGGRHDFSTRTVSWFLGDIKPGETREVKLEVQAVNPGAFKHKASAVGAHNLSAESELATRIEGLSALMLEMVDTEDPIEVGSETSYEVRISNTGSKVETDIKLAATIPDKMEFKSATGPVRFHEEGKLIVFEPLDKLAPRADAVFRITVKALDQGIVRFKIQMTSTNLTEPVIKMEATRIYSDAPETKSSN